MPQRYTVKMCTAEQRCMFLYRETLKQWRTVKGKSQSSTLTSRITEMFVVSHQYLLLRHYLSYYIYIFSKFLPYCSSHCSRGNQCRVALQQASALAVPYPSSHEFLSPPQGAGPMQSRTHFSRVQSTYHSFVPSDEPPTHTPSLNQPRVAEQQPWMVGNSVTHDSVTIPLQSPSPSSGPFVSQSLTHVLAA